MQETLNKQQSADLNTDLNADLRTMGLKVTVPRLKILDLFQKLAQTNEPGKRHLSAEEVYKLLLNENSDIGLATVYRVLTQFETAASLFDITLMKAAPHTSCRKGVITTTSSACAAGRLKSLSTRLLKKRSARSPNASATR